MARSEKMTSTQRDFVPIPQYPWQARNLIWRPAHCYVHSDIPPQLYPWLAHTGSFTAAMKAVCGDTLTVNVIQQAWQTIEPDEATRLDLSPCELALVRETEMWGNNQLWLVARLVFPRGTLTGSEEPLRYFGAQSVGEFLFADPTLERSPFEWTNLENSAGVGMAEWGRRSLFRIKNKPLLVTEFLCADLPAFPDRIVSGNR